MTLRELAKIAGVSHPTVSRALRNHPGLPRKTCLRIQRLAAKYGYAPHPMVSELMTKLPHIKHIARPTLAAITCWPGWRQHPILRGFYRGMESRSKQLGYHLEEFSLLEPDMSPERLSSILYARGIEGVLLCPFSQTTSRLPLRWERFVGIALGHSVVWPELHRVAPSYYENMLLVLRELKERGYRRIALALSSSVRVRMDSYVAAYSLYERTLVESERIPLFHEDCAPLVNVICPSRLPFEALDQNMRLNASDVADWLRFYRADALVCNVSPSVDELRQAGLRIPEELGYVTLDNSQASTDSSGIDLQPEGMGAAAVDMVTAHLHRRERGIPSMPKITTLQSRWHAGLTVPPRNSLTVSER
jgi:LacI family transcriptional regulator